MNTQSMYALLLAGGSGERLWPLSRKSKPKQFLMLNEQRSLLEETIARIPAFIPQERRWVVAAESQATHIAQLLHDAVENIVIEPEQRNTGPAIILSCFALQAQDPDAVVVVFPTDHYVANPRVFAEFVTHALDSALEQQKIVLLGVRPTHASSRYGYIEYQPGPSFPADVVRFCEKPSPALAQQYAVSKHMLWNIGVFCAPVSVLLRECETHAPELYKAVERYWENDEPYAQVPSIAIDYAVMERSTQLSVLPVDVVWYDVGNLTTFVSLRHQHKKNAPAIISVDSHNNVIETDESVVALIGINDLCIVQAEGILLIARRDETDKVKAVLDILRQQQFDEYL